jgi:hypothetical protein
MTILKLSKKLVAKLAISIYFIFFGLLVYSLKADAATNHIRTHQYVVTLDKALTKAEVTICFDGKAPEYLAVDYKKATKDLIEFPKADRGHIEFQGRYWKTKNLKDNACIQYKSDISSHLYRPKSSRQKEIKISFQSDNTWLWLPESFLDNENAEITFNLPRNYQVSAPWQPITLGNHKENRRVKRFKIGHTPHDWGFTVVIGEFMLKKIRLNQTEINLAILPNLKQKDELEQWVVDSFRSLNRYLNVIPLTHLQVILLENKRFKKGPVPWGDVKRGGGLAIRFVVNSRRAIEEFYADWTATHEFSHLLLPNIDRQDRWMSEGLASYLQYILMAQAGHITQQQAWQKLYEGFQRGIKGTEKIKSESLTQATKGRSNGDRYGRTMRIYWSGAAYFFIADWQLRELSQGKQTLADVLLKLNQCCIGSPKEWQGERLAQKMDELSETNIFTPLYTEIANSSKFPSTEKAFEALGIKVVDEKVVLLQTDKAELRSNILIPKN